MLEAVEALADMVAGAAQTGVVGERLETRLKLIEVFGSLGLSPCAKRECNDASQVGFGAPRKAKTGHGLALGGGEVEGFSDAPKYNARGDAA